MDKSAALGYTVIAMRELGHSEQHIEEVEAYMLDAIDEVSEDHAKKTYQAF